MEVGEVGQTIVLCRLPCLGKGGPRKALARPTVVWRFHFFAPTFQFVTTVSGGDAAAPAPPVVLIRKRLLSAVTSYWNTADSKRFLINTTGGAGAAASPPLTVVTNWNVGAKK